MKFIFFCQRHELSTSFDIFVVTYGMTNFLPKLVDMLFFSGKKLNFHFLNSPIFGRCPCQHTLRISERRLDNWSHPQLERNVTLCGCGIKMPESNLDVLLKTLHVHKSHNSIPTPSRNITMFSSPKTTGASTLKAQCTIAHQHQISSMKQKWTL